MLKHKCPKCDECGKELTDWSGNIMVEGKSYHDKIDDFLIWCKECTVRLDRTGEGNKFHNLWELSWLKKDYFSLEEELFEEVKEGQNRWSLDALKKINQLGRMVYEQ
ncbi:hypothetical protein [Aneurinibacillus aneurinilyticus]|uniref:Uncharacterized protein n=1 Tax=Aneurinibacillus aneurinilyticus ATCC 12856 TaxID=649747 RepID=U1WD56_ANEAE|nr:hypothetical protein [Aneurinibacillus aneurinilyticus]ERI06479.1 hypothetical protein HMPREF0083_05321 [Aneurinibacillus aneurinilyticus ATCC 12856]MED0707094.1 hypothetical protein [Aneurinibacillus aneurinilyticus]MED0732837.1 hypothetical protein [Aneurinibacillus aneurinilyticus]MED0740393.1 hypothetical protein [Aneurinibacillus aneurinilyticus]